MTTGRSVSRQRNVAARAARAPFIAFFDDDAWVEASAILVGLELLESGQAEVVGGPALTRQDVGLFEGAAGLTSGSRFGMCHASARARALGEPRATDGEEFSLCNLILSREAFLRVDGLDESLYPGEDPDLWRRLGRAGVSMMYHPDQVVLRGRRRTLGAFALQHFKYGQGRGARFDRWRPQEFIYLIPTIFALYLVLLPLSPLPDIGLRLYLLLSVLAGVRAGNRGGKMSQGLLSILLFPVMHVAYGLGMGIGLLGWGPKPGVGEPELTIQELKADTLTQGISP